MGAWSTPHPRSVIEEEWIYKNGISRFDRGKLKYSQKKLFHCHCVYQKSHKECHRSTSRTLQLQLVASHLVSYSTRRRRRGNVCPLCSMSHSTRVIALLSGQNASDLKASSSRGIGMNAWRTRAVVQNLWAVGLKIRALHTVIALQQFLHLYSALGLLSYFLSFLLWWTKYIFSYICHYVCSSLLPLCSFKINGDQKYVC